MINKEKFKHVRKRILIIGIIFSTILLSYIGFSYHAIQIENQQKIVNIKKNTNSTILFYRDDCPSCQSIFKYVIFQKDILGKNIQLVNTNQGKNRHYIGEYKLESVPTFVHSNYGKVTGKYSGTNLIRIAKVIEGR